MFYLFSVQSLTVTLIKAIDSVGDPPLPIPNREVKPDSADGTANICGRVGHRHFLKSTSVNSEVLFFVKGKGEKLKRLSRKKVWVNLKNIIFVLWKQRF